MEEVTLTGIFVKVDDCYIGYAKEEPSAITEGRTIDEAVENLIDAYVQLQIARRKRQERKKTSEEEMVRFEDELERSHKEVVHRNILVQVPA